MDEQEKVDSMEAEVDFQKEEEKAIETEVDEYSPLDYARDERVIPVINCIFKEIASLEDKMLGMNPKGTTLEQFKENKTTLYKDLSFKIIKSMIDNKVRMSDTKYLFSLVREATDTIDGFIGVVVDTKYDQVLCNVFGKEDINDIEIADVENKIVSSVK